MKKAIIPMILLIISLSVWALLMISLPRCADNYEHPQSYLDGYQAGYANHNETVLNACIDYIDYDTELSNNNKLFMEKYRMQVTYYPIEKQINYGGKVIHCLKYRMLNTYYMTMQELDEYAVTCEDHYVTGYIAGYDDWYNDNQEKLCVDSLESKRDNALKIINIDCE